PSRSARRRCVVAASAEQWTRPERLLVVFVVDSHEADDFERPHAAGRRDVDFVAFLAADERAAYGRGDRDEAAIRIGILGHDELDLKFTVAFAQRELRPEAGPVARDAVQVHQLNLRDAHPQHRDPGFDEALALLGRGVLGVLAQVAQLARPLYLLRQLLLQFT